MSRRSGPPPQPTALKILRGNPGKRPLPKHEPQPAPTSADAPSELSAAARALWDAHAPELARIHLLTILDRHELGKAMRLDAVGDLYAAEEERRLARLQAKHRPLRPSPAGWAALKFWKAASDILVKFGITPSERTRLQSPSPKEAPDRHDDPKPTDPLDQLTARRRARQAAAR